jgi:acetone carboxylase gamma subunit
MTTIDIEVATRVCSYPQLRQTGRFDQREFFSKKNIALDLVEAVGPPYPLTEKFRRHLRVFHRHKRLHCLSIYQRLLRLS